jgi:uncharacterized protein YndB with AHSA1/START domain
MGVTMPKAERTIVIARPQAEVYAFFADAENDTRWRPAVKLMRREGPLAVGTRYTQRLAGPGGQQVAADIEITALDPGTRVAFRGVAGPVRPTGGYSFAPAEGGTAVTFTLAAELTGIKKLVMATPVQKAMDAEMANLDKAKTLLESGG